MAHYAFINDLGIVSHVIVGIDEDDLPEGIESWEDYYGELAGQTCLRTSYNTRGNQHIDGGTPFRGNYAGIGYRYDAENDVFIPPRPFDSWVLDNSTWTWRPPIPYPTDGELYDWNESTMSCDLVET